YSLRLNWKQKIDSSKFFSKSLDGVDGAPFTEMEVLSNGQWQNKGTQNVLAYNRTDITSLGTQIEAANLIAPDFSENEPYTTQTTAGYLRYTLQGDWGHALYANDLAVYAKTGGTVPKPLYDPQLLDIVLDYLAVQEKYL
ncbi:MAG: hypothetical protein D6772_05860, partial [Bacteroidetes bacterium]